MKTKDIKNKLLKKQDQIKETLASFDEDSLRKLFNDELTLKSLMDYFIEHNKEASYSEFIDFIAMFYGEYKTPGSWDENHSKWKQQYHEYSKYVC